MSTGYDPARWFWLVADDKAQVYSSAAQNYVAPDDPTYADFLAQGNAPTRIASEEELRATLVPWGRALLAGEEAPLSVEQRLGALEEDSGAVKAALVKKALVTEEEIETQKPAGNQKPVSRV
jgi:hypothetical protein